MATHTLQLRANIKAMTEWLSLPASAIFFDYYDKDGEWKTCGKDTGNSGNRDDIEDYFDTDYDLHQALAGCYPDAAEAEAHPL